MENHVNENLYRAYEDESGERINELIRSDRQRLVGATKPSSSKFGLALFWTVAFLGVMSLVMLKLISIGAITGVR